MQEEGFCLPLFPFHGKRECGIWSVELKAEVRDLLKTVELFGLSSAEQKHWIDRIAAGDWQAAPYLAEHLRLNTFRSRYGSDGKVLLLTDGNQLISFCTLVRQDEIPDNTLLPWIGFVYTFPAYRGHRYSQKIISHACAIAKAEGHHHIYLSSSEKGLYEKYGFTPYKRMKTFSGDFTQVFIRTL